MPKPLSKATERLLLDALDDVSNLMESGEAPNDALYKVATERQITPSHLKLMVHAINTGLTNDHRLRAATTEEKAASFPLADADTVLGRMYPEDVKPSVKTAASRDYALPPDWVNRIARRKAAAAGEVLLANSRSKLEKTAAVREERDFAVSVKILDAADRDIRDKNDLIRSHESKAGKLRDQLQRYFQIPGHTPLKEVRANAMILFGKKAELVLAAVTKEAGVPSLQSEPVTAKTEPYGTIAQVLKLAEDIVAAKADRDQTVKEAVAKAEDLMRPFVPEPSVWDSVLARKPKPDLQKAAVGPGAPLMKQIWLMNLANMSKNIAGKVPDPSSLESKTLKDLTDPYHDTELRGLRAEALLHDLISNDEVVRGFPPEQVIDAYNEVSELAPYASTNKAMLRELLRKRLAGGPAGLDQFVIQDALRGQQIMHDMDPSRVRAPVDIPWTFPNRGMLGGNSAPARSSVLAK